MWQRFKEKLKAFWSENKCIIITVCILVFIVVVLTACQGLANVNGDGNVMQVVDSFK